jgi:hypothetical protein
MSKQLSFIFRWNQRKRDSNQLDDFYFDDLEFEEVLNNIISLLAI